MKFLLTNKKRDLRERKITQRLTDYILGAWKCMRTNILKTFFFQQPTRFVHTEIFFTEFTLHSCKDFFDKDKYLQKFCRFRFEFFFNFFTVKNCLRIQDIKWDEFIRRQYTLEKRGNKLSTWFYAVTHPGTPPCSMWFARVTSLLQTSYCHFFKPKTPHKTLPVCIPTRILKLTSVCSTMLLKTNLNFSSNANE